MRSISYVAVIAALGTLLILAIATSDSLPSDGDDATGNALGAHNRAVQRRARSSRDRCSCAEHGSPGTGRATEQLCDDKSPIQTMEPLEPGGLRVRIADSEGSPVGGVSVDLDMTFDAFDSGNHMGRAVSRASDGIAKIGLERFDRSAESKKALESLNPHYIVRAHYPQVAPVSKRLDHEPVAGETIEFIVERTGSVEFTVVTEDGTPAPEGTWVRASWNRPEELERNRHGSAGGLAVTEVVLGKARIERIGPGLVFSAWAGAPGFTERRLDWMRGPKSAGETVHAEVQLGPAMATIRARVISTDGLRALANEKLSIELFETKADSSDRLVPGSRQAVVTDENGGFSWRQAPGGRDEDRFLQVMPQVGDLSRGGSAGSEAPPPWRFASVALPRVIEPGSEVDLGDIVLEPVPVIAAGIVVDEIGDPVEGAAVTFIEPYGSARLLRRHLRAPTVTTGLDGRFEQRAVGDPTWLAVRVDKRGYDLYYEPDAFGSADEAARRDPMSLVLTLTQVPVKPDLATGKIAMEIHGGPKAPFASLGLNLLESGGGLVRTTECRPPSMGEFELEHIAPGTYTAEVYCINGGWSPVQIDGVEVHANQTTRDSRLLPLDLTEFVQSVHLMIVHPSGAPFASTNVVCTNPANQATSIGATSDTGRLSVAVPRSTSKLEVRVANHPQVTVELVQGTTTQKVVIPGE